MNTFACPAPACGEGAESVEWAELDRLEAMPVHELAGYFAG